ncbi:MAG TPA: S41 family peptidase [Acidimicrobiia bacterium]|nr:S41 family peptidase [Acidimicrobiia bacterium]
MGQRGYYRHPAIHGDRVVFVSEDDLWSVPISGGNAQRLTANPGLQTFPRFSPDGTRLAFTSRDEGAGDVFVMSADGGSARRLSHFGANTHVVGWMPDGGSVIAATDHRQPFVGWHHLWAISVDGGPARRLGVGPAVAMDHAPNGRGVVLSRHGLDPARWKRYRGGRAGTLWVDRDGSGDFEILVEVAGNLASPMWIGRRIWFVSDHEGVGNIYSVTPSGKGLTRHTDHRDFYVRFPDSDRGRIVYQAGADLYLLDTSAGSVEPIDVRIPSSRPQLNRQFAAPGRFLESVHLHPAGHSVALNARGAAFTMPLWEGAPRRHGDISRHRRRLTTWLRDGERIISVTDETGEEALIVERADGSGDPVLIEGDLGRIRSIDPSPKGAGRVAVTNHRHEVLVVDLTRKSIRPIHRSPHTWIAGTAWSPDGRWLAFSAAETRLTLTIHLYDTANRRVHALGPARFRDVEPRFDPTGRYLAFLSGRVFDPVADGHFHDHGFPRAEVPVVIPLDASAFSPFAVENRPARAPGSTNNDTSPGEKLDFDPADLMDRAQVAPVPPARMSHLAFAAQKLFFVIQPIVGSRPVSWGPSEPPKGTLSAWDFTTDKVEQVSEGVKGITLSADGKVLAILADRRIRVVGVGWKEDKPAKDGPGRESGWLDLDRIRIEVHRAEEWRQMYSEAWRLQRDLYWFESMGGVDWVAVHDRYAELVDRVGSRSEFSDLLWEMQGELGTSHAYEMGGSYRPEPKVSLGHLGVDLEWSRGAWRITRVPIGDPWDPAAASPLAAPGVAAKVGDRVLEVNGVSLDRQTDVGEALVDRGGQPVPVTLARGRSRPRTVVVRSLEDETLLRYRDWVESARQFVHESSDGRAGYLHIPDMMGWGYSEFSRGWLSELERDGLVVDVRFNRGGNVSQLLLQRLLRRRLGFRVTRWREPTGFPNESPTGPMVCLTNENAGSDGDIFSHAFKLHGLGPLIGTRTWGGVVGFWPQQSLVDGTVTTQPQFGTWFTDVGYAVENYGTDPDIEVVITPQDHAAGRDPQLERGVVELLARIEAAQPLRPDFGPEPSVRPPTLD